MTSKYVNLSTLAEGETANPNQATADLVVVGGDFAGGAAAGDTMTGTATAQADSTATDVAGLLADFNALLALLRARGVLASA
ncbi:Head fiber protein [Actinacidiphila epipremni]|uniref:Head fiber protein n=1 Tax=Actinacidiphila epipremni TaxID=2053013 RepID=A0ABX0ZES1_9ACTN|nr:Head fiber protein [Actinacidiphila epipremni]NJP42274.1 Head fiber protein [Actinacidiphila epipremni]